MAEERPPAKELSPPHIVLIVLLVLTLGAAGGAVLTGSLSLEHFKPSTPPAWKPITVP